NGRRFRILTLVDDFTRECLAVEVDFSLSGARVARISDGLIAERGKVDTIVSDNGPEFTSTAMDRWAALRGVHQHFIRPGRPMENAYIESFNGRLRDECLNLHWFIDLSDAREQLRAWRDELAPVQWTPGVCGQPFSGREYRELGWADVAQVCMTTGRVVEALDVLGDGSFGLMSGREVGLLHQLRLECPVEALRDRVVPTVTFAAHALDGSMGAKKAHEIRTGELAPPVGMNDEARGWTPRLK